MGSRLWIFRAIQPLGLFGAAAAGGLVISSPDPDAPSIAPRPCASLPILRPLIPGRLLTGLHSRRVECPTPSWWKGICNKDRYRGSSAARVFLSQRDHLPGRCRCKDTRIRATYFYPGAFPALEWECVELVLRFMYLAYGVPPYAANGNGIVYNYSGSAMEKVNGGIKGRAPVPGDVLSYCAWCTYGHTSVVTASASTAPAMGR